MTTPSAPIDSTSRELLIEARATLAATYWITGEEVAALSFVDERDFQLNIESGYVPTKHLKYTTADGTIYAVTGVCSIGAMALARHMNVRTPVEEFTKIETNDWQTFRASVALATAAVASGEHDELPLSRYPSAMVASWNDAKDETDLGREQILAGFQAAIASPLVTADTLWMPVDGNFHLGIGWATEQEAAEALTAGRAVYESLGDRDDFDGDDIDNSVGAKAWMRALFEGGYWDQMLNLVPFGFTAESFKTAYFR